MKIGITAHDSQKIQLADYLQQQKSKLRRHQIVATAGTGRTIQRLGLNPDILSTGNEGGYTKLGVQIAERKLDVLFLFPDSSEDFPKHTEVLSLLRLAIVYNIPVAMNMTTATLILQQIAKGQAWALLDSAYV